MGKKQRTSSNRLSLDDLDQAVTKRMMELVPLTDRSLGPEMVKALVGSIGQGISATDYDRKRGRAWIKYEIRIPIQVD